MHPSIPIRLIKAIIERTRREFCSNLSLIPHMLIRTSFSVVYASLSLPTKAPLMVPRHRFFVSEYHVPIILPRPMPLKQVASV